MLPGKTNSRHLDPEFIDRTCPSKDNFNIIQNS